MQRKTKRVQCHKTKPPWFRPSGVKRPSGSLSTMGFDEFHLNTSQIMDETHKQASELLIREQLLAAKVQTLRLFNVSLHLKILMLPGVGFAVVVFNGQGRVCNWKGKFILHR